MTQSEIAVIRLHNQHLIDGNLNSAAALVQFLGAVQAQEYQPTKWGLGIRLANLTEKDIDAEINSGQIIRTHLLRPTWHFVHADDLRWIQSLTAPRVQAINKYMYGKLELTPKALLRSANLICKLLEDQQPKTRNEIAAALSKKKINTTGMQMSYMLMNAELQALICSGVRKGAQHTYRLVEKEAGDSQLMKKERGLLELTCRYMRSRGPATVKDFSTWSGLSMAVCKAGIEAAGKILESSTCSGETYYHYPVDSVSKMKNESVLLPIYDELIMGYKDRQAIMQKKPADKPFRFDSMVLHKGQVAGTYRRTLSGKSAVFEFDFFQDLNNQQKASIDSALRRYGKFFGVESNVADFKR